MDDHFTLQWNDYQNHLMNAFTSLRNDKDFVDLTLSCEGRKISSHKMLLSACSPYFRGLLKDNPCPHPVIILRQTSYEDLVAIIHFVYNGEVSLHQSRVKSFIKTAKSLKIRGLCEASEFGEEEEESVPSHEDQPQRKKVKLEDEEDEFGKDWTFDYGGSAGDIPDESSTPNAVIAEGRPTSQKRRAISLETKLDILKRKDRGDRSTDIANAYGFGTSTVCTILKNRDQILKLSSIPCMMGSFYDTTRTRGGKMHEMERILNTWILEQNEMNSVLNGPVIQEKAREIWVDIGGLDEEDGKKFVASNGWFTRFRKRNNLQIVKNIGRSDNNASSTGSASFSSS
ncbi:uncharacterized protein [Lepeophtheirus salmonis]|uniref:uncharacterized protein isoform X2 n=1 Tax=Lepeophtheirus salmonis TaxID=72036 RepID=UPI001AEABA8C|nr:uncharacterized protein LOC121128241 isoform X2 [Lepeophtheirus salmonis]